MRQARPSSTHILANEKIGLLVPFALAASLLAFEGLKQFVWPDIRIWASHAITIAFGSAVGTAAVSVVRGRLLRAHERAARAEACFRDELAALLRDVERSAAQTEAILASVEDAILVFDRSRNLVRMNATARRLLPGEGGADALFCLARPGDDAAVTLPSLVERALAGSAGERALFEWDAGEKRWFSAGAAPIRERGGTIAGAVLSLTDVTSLRELQRLHQDLLSIVSHDLRTPLGVIQGRVSLLDLEAGKEGFLRSLPLHTRAIRSSTESMSLMVQDLIDLARKDAGILHLDRRSLDLSSFVGELLSRVEGSMPRERIRLEIPAGLDRAMADPARLERILLNLLSNALRHSKAPVTVRADADDGMLEVSVRDEGEGIAPEDLPHLFERFYRTRSSRTAAGLGLGLHICRLLVEAGGGHIWARSEPGKGSTFSFTLPYAVAAGDASGALH